MSETIRRYTVDYRGDLYPRKDGPLVWFTDHAEALAAERAAREAAERRADEKQAEADRRTREVEATYRVQRELTLRAEAAEARNARLVELCNDALAAQNELHMAQDALYDSTVSERQACIERVNKAQARLAELRALVAAGWEAE